jgi:hypothetical protein
VQGRRPAWQANGEGAAASGLTPDFHIAVEQAGEVTRDAEAEAGAAAAL